MRKLKRKREGGFSLGILWILLAILIFFLRQGVKGNPVLLERLYPLAINQKIIWGISQITGVFPFSVGELFVYLHGFIAVAFVVAFLVKLFRGGAWTHLYHGLVYVSLLFIIFMMTFGFSYERDSVRSVFALEKTNYTVEDLYHLNEALIVEANKWREGLSEDEQGVFQLENSNQVVLVQSMEAYVGLQEDYPIFKGDYGQAKEILSSELLNYTGITGIFMPFTGEANVNVKGPDLFFPSTILHEMAHQRGVAYEGEANYVAYVASLYHEDPVFKYSGTMLALVKSMNALYKEDRTLYSELRGRYNEELNRDLSHYSKFYEAYEGKVNEQATKVNDTYLKTNGQSQGVKSYDDMVNLLLEQFMQNGKL